MPLLTPLAGTLIATAPTVGDQPGSPQVSPGKTAAGKAGGAYGIISDLSKIASVVADSSKSTGDQFFGVVGVLADRFRSTGVGAGVMTVQDPPGVVALLGEIVSKQSGNELIVVYIDP